MCSIYKIIELINKGELSKIFHEYKGLIINPIYSKHIANMNVKNKLNFYYDIAKRIYHLKPKTGQK